MSAEHRRLIHLLYKKLYERRSDTLINFTNKRISTFLLRPFKLFDRTIKKSLTRRSEQFSHFTRIVNDCKIASACAEMTKKILRPFFGAI